MKKKKYISRRKSKAGTISWQVVIPYTDEDNEKQIYNKSFSEIEYGTAAAARRAALDHRDRMIIEIRSGRVKRRAPTIAPLYKRSLDVFPQRYNTRRNHYYFYRHAVEAYGNMEIQDVKVADIQQSINDYASTHTRDMTMKCLGVWKQIYKTAAVLEIPIPDKTVGVVIPRQTAPEKKKPVSISDEDFSRFLATLQNYHQYDAIGRYRSRIIWFMLMIAYHTGMRPSEIYALTADDVHLDAGHPYISVNKAIGSDLTQRNVPVKVKSASGYRDIPVSEELHRILADLMSWTKHEYLISDYDGSIFSTDFVSNYIHLVSKAAGVPFNAYMLRHKFATDLQRTEAPRTVQDLMGHASFSMSMEYARSSEDDRIQAVKNRKTPEKVVSKVVSDA
ncbi:MAG: site-specific integrase [Solobacterium sp.]|nr:site-specific integrase [Solobacterium sp.]